MFYELDETELKQIKEIEKITLMEYEKNGNYISVDDLMLIAKDMLCMYHILEEKIKGE